MAGDPRDGPLLNLPPASAFFCLAETTPTPARTAAALKLPVAEKQIEVKS